MGRGGGASPRLLLVLLEKGRLDAMSFKLSSIFVILHVCFLRWRVSSRWRSSECSSSGVKSVQIVPFVELPYCVLQHTSVAARFGCEVEHIVPCTALHRTAARANSLWYFSPFSALRRNSAASL